MTKKTFSLTPAMRAALLVAAQNDHAPKMRRIFFPIHCALWEVNACERAGLLYVVAGSAETGGPFDWRITSAGLDALRAEVST